MNRLKSDNLFLTVIYPSVCAAKFMGFMDGWDFYDTLYKIKISVIELVKKDEITENIV